MNNNDKNFKKQAKQLKNKEDKDQSFSYLFELRKISKYLKNIEKMNKETMEMNKEVIKMNKKSVKRNGILFLFTIIFGIMLFLLIIIEIVVQNN